MIEYLLDNLLFNTDSESDMSEALEDCLQTIAITGNKDILNILLDFIFSNSIDTSKYDFSEIYNLSDLYNNRSIINEMANRLGDNIRTGQTLDLKGWAKSITNEFIVNPKLIKGSASL